LRTIKEIDIDKSINKQKLVFKVGWYDILDSVITYFFFSMFSVAPLLMYFDPHRSKDPNDNFFYLYILPIWVLLGLYTIYRKATEKHLIKINTSYNRQQNRQILLDFAGKQGFEIYRKSNNCLIFNEPTGFNSNYKKSTIFILEDGLVMFTILKDGFRLNLPTLTGHLFLRHDLKKLFKETTTTCKTNTTEKNYNS